jgi:hypothetical protein
MTTESKSQQQIAIQTGIKDSDHLKNLYYEHIKPHQAIIFPLEYKVDEPDTYV